ncbi:MAG TPA: cytochrome c biogenesis CcdA family protein [Methanospirillum sp.]|nr:cytochrome c biogenesis CcdA family protein [Methanospirillum sp.]
MYNSGLRIIFLCFLCILAVFISSASAEVYLKNGSTIPDGTPAEILIQEIQASNEPISSAFFYNTHCGACHEARSYLTDLAQIHPEIYPLSYDLFNNTTNGKLFDQAKLTYNREHISYPVIFIGPIVLEGNEAISAYFEPLALAVQKKQKNPVSGFLSGITGLTSGGSFEIGIPLILGAGLLDGINPCAFAVLVFLLTYLLSLNNRRRVLLVGLVYTAAVFIFYFLSGVGIFTLVQTTGLVSGFSFIAGIVALIFAMIMIKDALFPGIGPSLAIPESRKETIHRFVEKSSIPAAFILGILVGMFELPCTGGIYLSIISMISLKTNLIGGLWYLFIYNLAFIFPLLVIIALIYWGIPPERVNEWRIDQRRSLRLIIGLIMLIFAVMILREVLI